MCVTCYIVMIFCFVLVSKTELNLYTGFDKSITLLLVFYVVKLKKLSAFVSTFKYCLGGYFLVASIFCKKHVVLYSYNHHGFYIEDSMPSCALYGP